MGYSCSAVAGDVLESIRTNLCNGSNTFKSKGKRFFFEIGRENSDGSITGKIWKFLPNDLCLPSGNFKISSNGNFVRAPKIWKDTLKKFPPLYIRVLYTDKREIEYRYSSRDISEIAVLKFVSEWKRTNDTNNPLVILVKDINNRILFQWNAPKFQIV